MRLFALRRPAIDVRGARFGREKMRDASLLANDFMVGGLCLQNLSAKKTYPSTAAEVW